MPKLYTRTGDKGETGLLYGGRVPKTDARVEAYGCLDEAISCMGLARALARSPRVQEILKDVQRECFVVGAELATDPRHYDKFQAHFKPVTSEMTARLERLIDSMEAEVKLPRAFIIPGASQGSAALDVARTVLRRAERRAVGLKEQGLLTNEEVLRYLNRLADLLFMLARYEDRDLPLELVTGAR
ncbi:MAG: cob(I)yrinic acid a,c-diamide adenosyltransferase [Chloroflexi bacterium]|nr:cob(I)yrinic acid a,c-diamide adenosyltransferase [Chloroflexota bacterium]